MTQPSGGARWGRSVASVLAGFVVTAGLSLAADAVMHATGVFPPWGQAMNDGLFVLATGYRSVFTVLGGYVTAMVAPRTPMTHVLVGGLLGTVLAAAGAAATWNAGPEFGPHWYPITLVVTGLPCALAGGWLWTRRATEVRG